MEVGLYGKLPSHGDFLRRRVDNEFIGVWDAWLQECIAHSRSVLGDDWLDIYLTSPVWRFVCDAGTCGAQAYAGLIAPSVDRVGRYFPLTLVWAVPTQLSPFAVQRMAARWFDSAEKLIVETLAAERIDFEEFDRQLTLLDAELLAVRSSDAVILDPLQAAEVLSDGSNASATSWRIPIESPDTLVSMAEQLLYARLHATHQPLVMLWTEGSAAIAPGCLLVRGLPQPDAFVALLDGAWSDGGWQNVAAQITEQAFVDTYVNEAASLSYRSAALSDQGKIRTTNQDSFLERAEIGLWAVADGLGGHRDGDLASRMVCDALASIVPAQSLELTIVQVEEQLQAVNAHLQAAANRPVNPVQSGTTVVVLLVRGDHCAILWVGDSRVYRLRGGQLQQLTVDHSWAQEGDAESDSNVITRAIGGEPILLVDIHRDRVRPEDRYLLCSDGLTRQLADAQIAAMLQRGDVTFATQNLITETLAAGAPDNVTVIAVDAYDDKSATSDGLPIL